MNMLILKNLTNNYIVKNKIEIMRCEYKRKNIFIYSYRVA